METAPEMFAPATDGWGKWGSTIVRLEAADEATLWDALATAWRNVTGVPIDPFKDGDADNLNDAVDNRSIPHVPRRLVSVLVPDSCGAHFVVSD